MRDAKSNPIDVALKEWMVMMNQSSNEESAYTFKEFLKIFISEATESQLDKMCTWVAGMRTNQQFEKATKEQ